MRASAGLAATSLCGGPFGGPLLAVLRAVEGKEVVMGRNTCV